MLAAQLRPFHLFQGAAHEVVLPTFNVGLLVSNNSVRKFSYKYVQGPIFQMILEFVNMTVNTITSFCRKKTKTRSNFILTQKLYLKDHYPKYTV